MASVSATMVLLVTHSVDVNQNPPEKSYQSHNSVTSAILPLVAPMQTVPNETGLAHANVVQTFLEIP
jgi:hypothetical protein